MEYPQSKILAKVTISDCIQLNPEKNKDIINDNPLVYGNKFDRTGYAWKLENVEKINNEGVVRGKLGLWNYENNTDEN